HLDFLRDCRRDLRAGCLGVPRHSAAHEDPLAARGLRAARRGTVGSEHPRAGDSPTATGGRAMSTANLVALVLLLLIAAYTCGGGADFGAGIWDLFAGDKDRGARPRELFDYAMAPVWEANNVWLVFILVVTWTGFPPVFEAVVSTTWIAVTI